MNLKLNVVRLANEDVIATSGVCTHIDAIVHIYVDSISGNDFSCTIYESGDEKLTYYNLGSGNNTQTPFDYVTKKGWYYLDGSDYIYCEDQDDSAHPKQNN